ncbi:hypothetical protein SBC2_78940 (plasmid) [Caballeronia sp. SBC2]|nr:hypothetical protein SBC2_78940 [Caballeronia sp. SBC2]
MKELTRYSTIFIAIGALAGPLCFCNASTADAVGVTRQAYVHCLRNSLDKFAELSDLTPAGVIYFVGLACAGARHAYAEALNVPAVGDSNADMKLIDAITIQQLLTRLNALRSGSSRTRK